MNWYVIIFLHSLYCLAIHNAGKFEYVNDDYPHMGVVENSKMFLWRIRFYSLKYLGKFYSKGVITCPPCMALLHSFYFFWPVVIYLYGFHPIQILIYLFYAGALSGLNLIAVTIIELIESITDKNNYQ